MHNKKTIAGEVNAGIHALVKSSNHILIGGIQGAGKSVLESIIINSLMFTGADVPALVLIDPKCIDLYKFSKMRNVVKYCDDTAGARAVFNDLINTMEARYKRARVKGLDISDERPIYCIIDELADLVLCDKSLFTPLQRLLAKGRASRIHIIACTQVVTAQVLPPIARYNFDCIVALRCGSAMASRLLIDRKGAEELPRHGRAIVKNADGVRVIDVPLLPAGQIERVIKFWE